MTDFENNSTDHESTLSNVIPALFYVNIDIKREKIEKNNYLGNLIQAIISVAMEINHIVNQTYALALAEIGTYPFDGANRGSDLKPRMTRTGR